MKTEVPNLKKKKAHYELLDSLRGGCVLSMVIYHGMYDIVNIMGLPVPWFWEWPGYVWQQSICWTFILLSGMCWRLSKRHWQRGLFLLGCAAVISAVTYVAMPSEFILYGVLCLLGLSALLLIPLDTVFNRLPAGFSLLGAAVLFFLFRGVPGGYLGFEGLRLLELPSALYQWNGLAWLGLPGPGFSSSDYFPLVPWFFLYCAGYFLWKVLSRSEKALGFLKPGFAPLSFIGRHSLLIYLLHQPVLMGAFTLLF